MTIHLVTFASNDMSRSRELCVESGLRHGCSLHWLYTPDIIQRFPEVQDHPEVFIQPCDPRRAFAHWAWKPLIINEVSRELNDGDVLIYADAGVEFINDVNHIISHMDQDIFLFGNQWEHWHWTKADIVRAVFPDTWTDHEWRAGAPFLQFGKQCQASVIFFKVTDYSKRFVKEWLDWCLFEGGRLIDDSPSKTPNHPEFQENRHDQAILTTLAYREGLRLHWWGARYNMDQPGGGFIYPKSPEYAADDYEPFVWHHRKRNHEWEHVA